jgi:hypothetical protein
MSVGKELMGWLQFRVLQESRGGLPKQSKQEQRIYEAFELPKLTLDERDLRGEQASANRICHLSKA